MNDFDENGNTTATFEDTVDGITDLFMGGEEESKSPREAYRITSRSSSRS